MTKKYEGYGSPVKVGFTVISKKRGEGSITSVSKDSKMMVVSWVNGSTESVRLKIIIKISNKRVIIP